jgi:hypothetical protein
VLWASPTHHACGTRWVDRRLAAIVPQRSPGDARQAFRPKKIRCFQALVPLWSLQKSSEIICLRRTTVPVLPP